MQLLLGMVLRSQSCVLHRAIFSRSRLRQNGIRYENNNTDRLFHNVKSAGQGAAEAVRGAGIHRPCWWPVVAAVVLPRQAM